MSTIDKFGSEVQRKEEINPKQGYPIIWKRESCLKGECKEDRTAHRWAVPFSDPDGLVTECYDCHKSRRVYTEKSEDVWLNKEPSDFVKKRLAELNRNT